MINFDAVDFSERRDALKKWEVSFDAQCSLENVKNHRKAVWQKYSNRTL